MINRLNRITRVPALLTITFAAFHLAVCQNNVPQSLPGHSKTGFSGAENRWRLGIVDRQAQVDPLPPAVRAQRDLYWKTQLQIAKDFEHQGLKMLDGGGLSGGIEVPEISHDEGAIWVIASFDSFSVFSVVPDGQTSPADLLIYTEMNFTTKYLIFSPRATPLSIGSSFQVDLPGGRVKLPSGTVVSWRVSPVVHSVQPQHTYLLELLPLSGGLFRIAQRWDMTSGKAVPDTPTEIERARVGASKVSGMTVADVLSYIPGVLSTDNK